MNNCILSKLMGSANNDSLQKYNVIRLVACANLTDKSINIRPAVGQTCTLTIVNPKSGESFSNGSTQVTNTNALYERTITCEKDCVIEVSNKYNILTLTDTTFGAPSFAIKAEDFCYMQNLYFLALGGRANTTPTIPAGSGIIGDISAIKNISGLTLIKIAYNQNVYGAIDELIRNNPNISDIDAASSNIQISDINCLNSIPNLTSLTIPAVKTPVVNINFFLNGNSLKFTNLTTLNIAFTGIYGSSADVQKLRDLGVTVSIVQNQIID